MAGRADPREIQELYSDAPTYLVPAHSLLEHGVLLDGPGKPMIRRTPGYPALLALLMFVFGQNLHEIMLIQAFLLSASVLVLYWLARRTLPPVMAFVGAILAALSPWGAVLAGVVMSDGPFVLVLATTFLLMKIVDETQDRNRALLGASAVGLLTAVAVLIRPLWPLVIVVPAALSVCYGLKRKGVWLVAAATLVCSVAPVGLWLGRNNMEAHFNGLSNVPGNTAWRYLAARVKAEVSGGNRHAASAAAYEEDGQWRLSDQQKDQEHWRRANEIFRQHPVITAYSFVRSATEHAIHPSPDVLVPAKLSFRGDFFVLAIAWAALLGLATVGVLCTPDPLLDDGEINRLWLLSLLSICCFLTLLSGMSFAAGSRLRAPLDLIIPLFSAIGFTRVLRAVHRFIPGRRPADDQ